MAFFHSVMGPGIFRSIGVCHLKFAGDIVVYISRGFCVLRKRTRDSVEGGINTRQKGLMNRT